MLHPLRAALTVALTLALAVPALAAEPDGPRARTDAIYSRVQAAAAEATDRDALVERVLGYLDTFIDYDGFSARTLRVTWPTLNAAQREDFKGRFKQLVIRTYAKKFTPGATFEVEYRGKEKFTNEARSEARVKSTVKHERVAADVDYLMTLGEGEGAAWRAIDIVIDDVSMALNWRRQFERIVAKDGFDALIKRIDERVDRDADE